MGAVTKTFLAVVYFGFLNIAITKMISFAMQQASPHLPPIVSCLAIKSGAIDAINLFLIIIIYGFTIKQLIAYFRTVN